MIEIDEIRCKKRPYGKPSLFSEFFSRENDTTKNTTNLQKNCVSKL